MPCPILYAFDRDLNLLRSTCGEEYEVYVVRERISILPHPGMSLISTREAPRDHAPIPVFISGVMLARTSHEGDLRRNG